MNSHGLRPSKQTLCNTRSVKSDNNPKYLAEERTFSRFLQLFPLSRDQLRHFSCQIHSTDATAHPTGPKPLPSGGFRPSNPNIPRCRVVRGIILAMARGWESKSVEEQQAEATSSPPRQKSSVSPEEIAKSRKTEGLLLSRKRLLHRLQEAQNPSHRKMLEDALAELDARLSHLS